MQVSNTCLVERGKEGRVGIDTKSNIPQEGDVSEHFFRDFLDEAKWCDDNELVDIPSLCFHGLDKLLQRYKCNVSTVGFGDTVDGPFNAVEWFFMRQGTQVFTVALAVLDKAGHVCLNTGRKIMSLERSFYNVANSTDLRRNDVSDDILGKGIGLSHACGIYKSHDFARRPCISRFKKSLPISKPLKAPQLMGSRYIHFA